MCDFVPPTTSQKSYKLLELRDRLARLNSPHRANPATKKLHKIYQQNKLIESEISALFDRISKHYYQSEECISQLSRQAIATIQCQESVLLKELDALKEKQLDSIKEDVEQYLQHSKKIKRLMSEAGNNSSTEEEIKKIKPFPVKGLWEKIEAFSPDSSQVDLKITQFKEKLAIFIDQLSETASNPAEKGHPNILKISNIAKRSSDLSSMHEDYSRFLRKEEVSVSERSHVKEEEESNLMGHASQEQEIKDILEGDRKTEKWETKKRVKGEIAPRGISQNHHQQTQGAIVKEAPMKSHDEILQVRQFLPDPTIEKSQPRNFLAEIRAETKLRAMPIHSPMHRPSNFTIGKVKSETATPYIFEDFAYVSSRNKSHRLSRVRSEDKLHFPLQRTRVNNQENSMGIPSDEEKEHTDLNLRKLREQLNTNELRIHRSNEIPFQKELRSVRSAEFNGRQIEKQRELRGRKGDWASILKQQQAHYNEMRRRMKN